ncbi:MAG: carbohydrate kinase family protein [Planctomycetota bacterium]|jgi:sugar/nucleoside kinase (ribokinase family)|nr:carbohydrate kinase family protein [Planctomycetota bacterium]
MSTCKTDALVVGHFCLDIIPTFPDTGTPLAELFVPGRLVEVGDAVVGTGGAANNTGLALHRLGFRTGIVAKVGNDIFGDAALKLLRNAAPHLADNMIVSPADGTSYSVVLNPPGVDRIFLHASAANDTFDANDVPDSAFDGARHMHFGYPPLMRRFQMNDGAEVRALFERARARGLTTSLDMARPDPNGPSGKVDWIRFMENVLPATDAFLPSMDEILFMLDRKRFDALQEKAGDANPTALLDIDTIRKTAERLIGMGAAIVGLKLGDQGFYLRTTSDPGRLARMDCLPPANRDAWLDQEIATGCRKAKVAGTTGAGDCTIAGFLGALLKGMSADEAVSRAVAVGGASVESRDATSGVPAWSAIEERLAAGWPGVPSAVIPDTWTETPEGNRKRA